jgi:hypothetical protein
MNKQQTNLLKLFSIGFFIYLFVGKFSGENSKRKWASQTVGRVLL